MKSHNKRRNAIATFGLAAISAAIMPGIASAQANYPDHPIKLVAPFAPGGGVDIIARLSGQMISEALGQPVVVENRPGAASNIGAAFVAHSKADGYTLLLASGSLAVNQSLFVSTGFNATKDFVRIARVAEAPGVLLVAGTSSIKTAQELVSYAKAHPDEISFGSTGPGSNQHLNGAIVAQNGGFKATHVPYKGGPAAETDLIAGRITYFVAVPSEVLGFIKSGQLRPLAVTGDHRLAQLPDVPTFKEVNFKEDGVGSWWGIAAPAGTPKEDVDKISAALLKALKQPAYDEKLAALGVEAAPLDARQFETFFQGQVKKYADLIAKFHIERQ
jgi:tripartite-type tricarboxylate transporter receptor subunit TctC